MARIALVTTTETVAGQLREAVPPGHHVFARAWGDGSGADASRIAVELSRDGFDVVCMAHGVAPDDILETASALELLDPDVVVVMVADADADLLGRALRAGVREVIPLRSRASEFTAGMRRAIETSERRRSTRAGAAAGAVRHSRVITVLSPKGGSGKTFLATNLATGLAARFPGDVAIVDLDTHFGDVAPLLSLSPNGTLGDLATSASLDATVLKVLLTPREPGLFALCAPDSPAQGDEVTAEHATASLTLMAEAFATLVVDTAAGLDERTLAAIELSTDVLFVCTMDVASVRSLRKEIDTLDHLGMTGALRHFVLNRCDARVGLEASDIQAVVGLPAVVNVPSSRAVPNAMNRGLPVLEAEPRSPVAKALSLLVDVFAPASQGVANGAFGRRKARR